MHWLDLVIIGFVALSTFRGLRTGLIRQVVGLASVIAGGIVAANLYARLADNIDFVIADPLARQLVAFAAIFAGILVLGQIAANLLRTVAGLLFLGPMDSLGGAAFGFLQALLLVLFALFALTAFPVITPLEPALRESTIAPVLLDALPLVQQVLPDAFRAAIEAYREGGGLPFPVPLPPGGAGTS